MSNWISVKDELPSCKGEFCLVWNGRWVRVAYYRTDLSGVSAFFAQNTKELDDVTHWLKVEIPNPNLIDDNKN